MDSNRRNIDYKLNSFIIIHSRGEIMDVILSIKPKYVEKILSGEKQYEFRKRIFKDTEVENIFIYASSPVKMIVAVFRPSRIIRDSPQKLWMDLWPQSGLTEEEFFNYFVSKDEGYAIRIDDLVELEEPRDPRQFFPGFVAPQNFMYVYEDGDFGT